MRVVRGEAERLVDPLLELLADHVLEPVGLVVHVVDVKPERAREVELEQSVVADHLHRNLFPRSGQPHTPVRSVLDEPKCGELLHHGARRGGRDLLPAGERSDGDTVAVGLQVVERLQVVLDRLRQRGLPHCGPVYGHGPALLASGRSC